MKAKILIDGLNHNGKELKKGKTEELPWQIVNNWSVRGWVEPAKDGGENELQAKTDNPANTRTSNASGSKGRSKDTDE